MVVEMAAWVYFWVAFVALGVFDIRCLAPRPGGATQRVTMKVALGHTLFWFLVGIVFNIIVWAGLGAKEAVVWFNGYILEYMLSMDNVFFFQVVFTAYATPEQQLYKALFFGVLFAVLLRFFFYSAGAALFRSAFILQILFGLVLIYSGYKTATTDDDDEDPREYRCVKCMTRRLPLIDEYDSSGALFVRRLPRVARHSPSQAPEPLGQVIGMASEEPEACRISTTAVEAGGRGARHGTMLLLVVLVLGIVDVLFAVDSVTAKLAENSQVFVNFSSSAFAMLCLRSMFFLVASLQAMFRLLKYGVALILVFIGVKLIANHWVDVHFAVSLVAILVVFALSIVASVVIPDPEKFQDLEEDAHQPPEGLGSSVERSDSAQLHDVDIHDDTPGRADSYSSGL